MKLKKILSTSDPLFTKVKTRVIVKRDYDTPDPLHDYDQVFYMHSMITPDFCGNESDKGYVSPLVEIEDEDGCGTGKFKFREGVVAFPVAAYIHSGIAFSLGDGSRFPDQQWDVVRGAAYLWTDKNRFEKMCAPWMTVYDETLGRRRLAKDEAEFKEDLRKLAKGELKTLQTCMDGYVYGYVTEERQEFKKVYPDGREEQCFEYNSTEDSCWGFVQDQDSKYFDMDAEKSYDDSVEWFTDDDYLVGVEYGVPEFVVTMVRPVDGMRTFLSGYQMEGRKCCGQTWTCDIRQAVRFLSWGKVQSVAQGVIPKGAYDAYKNCVEVDSLKETP